MDEQFLQELGFRLFRVHGVELWVKTMASGHSIRCHDDKRHGLIVGVGTPNPCQFKTTELWKKFILKWIEAFALVPRRT